MGLLSVKTYQNYHPIGLKSCELWQVRHQQIKKLIVAQSAGQRFDQSRCCSKSILIVSIIGWKGLIRSRLQLAHICHHGVLLCGELFTFRLIRFRLRPSTCGQLLIERLIEFERRSIVGYTFPAGFLPNHLVNTVKLIASTKTHIPILTYLVPSANICCYSQATPFARHLSTRCLSLNAFCSQTFPDCSFWFANFSSSV